MDDEYLVGHESELHRLYIWETNLLSTCGQGGDVQQVGYTIRINITIYFYWVVLGVQAQAGRGKSPKLFVTKKYYLLDL